MTVPWQTDNPANMLLDGSADRARRSSEVCRKCSIDVPATVDSVRRMDELLTAAGTFKVTQMTPQPFEARVTTGLPTGYALMRKEFDGAITGSSQTQFVYAYDEGAGGTYVAMESFEGTIDGRSGTCNIAHSATTSGTDRTAEMLLIVPGSGVGELVGITGSGTITFDADGTHHLRLDYRI